MKNLYLVPVLLIALIGAIFWGVSQREGSKQSTAQEASLASTPEIKKLELGKDYYICPTLIETTPQTTATSWIGGDPIEWDLNGTGPDVECKIAWNGNVVFSSGEKSDSIIANWSPIGADVANLILSGKIRLDSVIQAASIKFEEGGSIDLQAWDKDALGKEEIGSVNIPLDSLQEGKNNINADSLAQIRRIEILAIPKDQPEAKLIQQLLEY